MAIHLGCPLPDTSRDLPEDRRGKAPEPVARLLSSYLVLLPVRFAQPLALPSARCALTAPFHPYRPEPLLAAAGGIVSVALSLGLLPPGVTRHRPSVEPGLSSLAARKQQERPSGHLAVEE